MRTRLNNDQLKQKAVQRTHTPTTTWLFCLLHQKAQPAGFARTRPAPGKAFRALTKSTTCSQNGRRFSAPRRCAISPTRLIGKKRQARPPSVAGELSGDTSAAPDASRAGQQVTGASGASRQQVPKRFLTGTARGRPRRFGSQARSGGGLHPSWAHHAHRRRPGAAPPHRRRFWPRGPRRLSRPAGHVLLPRPGGGPASPATRQCIAAGRRAPAPAAAAAGRRDE